MLFTAHSMKLSVPMLVHKTEYAAAAKDIGNFTVAPDLEPAFCPHCLTFANS